MYEYHIGTKRMFKILYHPNYHNNPKFLGQISFAEANLMLETILQSLNFIPHTVSEELIFQFFFLQILPFGCHGNQSN